MEINPFVGRWRLISIYRNDDDQWKLDHLYTDKDLIWEFDEEMGFTVYSAGRIVLEAVYIFQPERRQVFIYNILRDPIALYMRMQHKSSREYWFYEPDYVNQSSEECKFRVTARKIMINFYRRLKPSGRDDSAYACRRLMDDSACDGFS